MADITTAVQLPDKGDYIHLTYRDMGDGTYALVTAGGAGTDSGGNALPAGFDKAARTYGYDGNDNLTSEVVTIGAGTWTKTYGYTNGNLASESEWVKS